MLCKPFAIPAVTVHHSLRRKAHPGPRPLALGPLTEVTMLKLITFSPAMVYANCYILKDTESGEALVVDPGCFNKRLEAILKDEGISSLRYILLTHGHFDHISGVGDLQSAYGGEVVIHLEDAPCLHNRDESLASKFHFSQNEARADIVLDGGEELSFGNYTIKALHTPGHTRGSVCYIIDGLMFSGDTLFKDTVGRTDFPGGSYEEMMLSMKKLASLDEDYKVYPGHDVNTTLKREKCFNPYMKGI